MLFLLFFPFFTFCFVCFLAASSQFVSLANKDVNLAGRTKLDRERLKTCMREMVRLVQRINSIYVCERARERDNLYLISKTAILVVL